MPIIKKKGPFSILLGALRVIFQTPLFHKKSYLGGKIGCETKQNSCVWVLFLKRENL